MSANIFANGKSWRDPYFWLTILLSFPAAAPLLHPDYHWGAHDARHAVYFLHQFDQVIRDGIWYPRWAPDFAFGQGYPFFNIYGPLSSYSGQFFLIFGFDYPDAVKLVFGLSLILSGLTMYLFARRLMGPQAGLIAGICYVYLPYHLLDIYVRAALAESVSFVFVPLIFWSLYEAATRPTIRSIILGGLVYAGLLMTSNLVAFLLSPFLGLYVLALLLPDGLNLKLIIRGIPSAVVIILGMCLSGIFFMPLVLERQFINISQWTDGGGRFVFSAFFVEFFQLFSPLWGFGIAVTGPDDQMSYQLGLVPVILFMLSFWLVPQITDTATKRVLRYMQGLVILISFLTLSYSLPVWNVLPLASLAQFPWRLLVIVAPALAILAGVVVQELTLETRKDAFLNVLPLTLLIILASYPYVQGQFRKPEPTEGPVNLAGLFRFQQSANELTGVTSWVEEIPTWSNMAEHIAQGGEHISTRVLITEITDPTDQTPLLGVHSFENSSAHEFVWVFAADAQQAVTFQIPFHPGWTATLYEDTTPDSTDPNIFPYGRIGQEIAALPIDTISPNGWMTIPVPPGAHFLEIRFTDTPIRQAGTWLTIITAILMGLGLILEKPISRIWKHRKNNQKVPNDELQPTNKKSDERRITNDE